MTGGSRWTRAGSLAAAAFAIVAIQASSASAGRPITYAGFEAKGSNGYELNFYARSGKAQHANLWLQRGRTWATTTGVDGELVDLEFSKGSTAASYDLKRVRRISRRRIEIRLGAVGSISLRFREQSSRRLEQGCLTGSLRRGKLVGELRFEGEDGYTTVDLHRLDGRIATVRRTCGDHRRRVSGGEAGRPAGAWRRPLLYACGPTPGTLLLANRDRYLSHFSALAFDRRPFAAITRGATAFRAADDFRYRRDLRSATLSPDPPIFSGSGKYREGAITGDLTARLPGLGATPMVPGDATLGREGALDLPRCPGVRYPFAAGAMLRQPGSPRGSAGRLAYGPAAFAGDRPRRLSRALISK